jgi:hypothetical protein
VRESTPHTSQETAQKVVESAVTLKPISLEEWLAMGMFAIKSQLKEDVRERTASPSFLINPTLSEQYSCLRTKYMQHGYIR